MSEFPAYTIEIDGESAGLVVAERRGFTFFAAQRPFHALDGHQFKTVIQAERAARALQRGLMAAAVPARP